MDENYSPIGAENTNPWCQKRCQK